MPLHRTALVRLALPLYWIALAIATHYPTVQIPGAFEWRDKIVHFATFGILAWLLWHFLTRTRPATSTTIWRALAVLVPYATLDEYTQQFVRRNTELADWIANIAGIVTALLVMELRRRARMRVSRS